ncbi:MAG: hypothetical protein ABWY12_09765 [Burkholderiales bacterium]
MTFEERRLKRLLANAGAGAAAAPGILKVAPALSLTQPTGDPRLQQIAAMGPGVFGPSPLPAAMPVAPAPPPPAQPSALQEGISNTLLGFGLGAATESPIGAGIGAGLGALGTYLNRRRKNPIRFAAGGAAKERKDFPRTRPPKKPKGMGAATRGHKNF